MHCANTKLIQKASPMPMRSLNSTASAVNATANSVFQIAV
jgi:hypothetical protein